MKTREQVKEEQRKIANEVRQLNSPAYWRLVARRCAEYPSVVADCLEKADAVKRARISMDRFKHAAPVDH